jgi:hypothetical protein
MHDLISAYLLNESRIKLIKNVKSLKLICHTKTDIQILFLFDGGIYKFSGDSDTNIDWLSCTVDM